MAAAGLIHQIKFYYHFISSSQVFRVAFFYLFLLLPWIGASQIHALESIRCWRFLQHINSPLLLEEYRASKHKYVIQFISL